jgi:hypothetical protein
MLYSCPEGHERIANIILKCYTRVKTRIHSQHDIHHDTFIFMEVLLQGSAGAGVMCWNQSCLDYQYAVNRNVHKLTAYTSSGLGSVV